MRTCPYLDKNTRAIQEVFSSPFYLIFFLRVRFIPHFFFAGFHFNKKEVKRKKEEKKKKTIKHS